jgi:hypothetical protein
MRALSGRQAVACNCQVRSALRVCGWDSGSSYEGLELFALALTVEQEWRTLAIRAGSAPGPDDLVTRDFATIGGLPREPRPPWMAIEWPDFLLKMH